MSSGYSLEEGINDPWSQIYIEQQLADYDLECLKEEHGDKVTANFFIKDDSGQLLGGICGVICWGGLFIHRLWIDEQIRKQGFGRKLIGQAEDKARSLGCYMALVQTTTFNNVDFYIKMGFKVSSMIENFPRNHCYYFLSKSI